LHNNVQENGVSIVQENGVSIVQENGVSIVQENGVSIVQENGSDVSIIVSFSDIDVWKPASRASLT